MGTLRFFRYAADAVGEPALDGFFALQRVCVLLWLAPTQIVVGKIGAEEVSNICNGSVARFTGRGSSETKVKKDNFLYGAAIPRGI